MRLAQSCSLLNFHPSNRQSPPDTPIGPPPGLSAGSWFGIWVAQPFNQSHALYRIARPASNIRSDLWVCAIGLDKEGSRVKFNDVTLQAQTSAVSIPCIFGI